MRARSYVSFLVLLASPSLLGACRQQPKPRPPLPVTTAVAQPMLFAEQVGSIGSLEAVEKVQLAAQAGGRIEQLLVQQGDLVRAGQLLVVLDQSQLQAEVASLRAARSKDRLNYERFEFLVNAGAASAIQRDEIRQRLIETSADLKAREADLAYKDLRAPIKGEIGDLKVKRGDVIKAGDPLTSLILNQRLFVRIDVPAKVRNRLQLGQTVLLSDPDANRELARAKVTSIDPSIKAGDQMLLVKAEIANPSGELRNGLRLRSRVVLNQRSQLSVPVAAIIQGSGQSYVFKLGKLADLQRNPGQVKPDALRQLPVDQSYALQTRVTLGPIANSRYPVLSGLSPGDVIITSQLLNLRHGTAVAVASGAASGQEGR